MKFRFIILILVFFVHCSTSITNSSDSISSEIPKFNNECKFTLEEGLNEIYKIAHEYNLSIKINWVEDNAVIVNSWEECRHYVVGNWIYKEKSSDMILYLYFLIILVFVVFIYKKLNFK